MTSRTPMDAAFLETRDRGTEGLAMFAEHVPDVRSPAPSAPGSSTSQAAAEAITHSPFRAKSHRVLMLCLGALSEGDCLSMEEISERTGMRIASICGRISDLSPLWIEKLPGARQSSAMPSLKVNGYRLTKAGRARLSEAA